VLPLLGSPHSMWPSPPKRLTERLCDRGQFRRP
jgi:hypothetical protein